MFEVVENHKTIPVGRKVSVSMFGARFVKADSFALPTCQNFFLCGCLAQSSSPKRNSAKSSSEVEFVHETVENIPKPVDEETQEEEALGEEHDYELFRNGLKQKEEKQ